MEWDNPSPTITRREGSRAMNADFFDAHDRHWQDAETLFVDSRLANADHLYGLSAECGLKRLMMAFGMVIDSYGKPTDKKDLVHIDGVWVRYESYRSGRSAANYILPSSNPFGDWDVSQRYANQSNFDTAHVTSHRYGTDSVRNLINKAKTEGLL